jgi:hypothetical protein
MTITWIKQQSMVKYDTPIDIPVYLNEDRSDVLFIANLRIQSSGTSDIHKITQQGVAFIAYNVTF